MGKVPLFIPFRVSYFALKRKVHCFSSHFVSPASHFLCPEIDSDLIHADLFCSKYCSKDEKGFRAAAPAPEEFHMIKSDCFLSIQDYFTFPDRISFPHFHFFIVLPVSCRSMDQPTDQKINKTFATHAPIKFNVARFLNG